MPDSAPTTLSGRADGRPKGPPRIVGTLAWLLQFPRTSRQFDFVPSFEVGDGLLVQLSPSLVMAHLHASLEAEHDSPETVWIITAIRVSPTYYSALVRTFSATGHSCASSVMWPSGTGRSASRPRPTITWQSASRARPATTIHFDGWWSPSGMIALRWKWFAKPS